MAKPTATAVAELRAEMDFFADTPGTLRFKEVGYDDSRPPIGSLYITKAAIQAAGLKGKHIEVIVRDRE